MELEVFLQEFKYGFDDIDIEYLFLVFDRDKSWRISIDDLKDEFKEWNF